jgi:NAD+ diphosphatase
MPLYPAFERVYRPDVPTEGPIRWLPLRGQEVLVQKTGDVVTAIADSAETRERLASFSPLTLGTVNGVTYLTCETDAAMPLPDGWRSVGLRNLYGLLDETEWEIAGYATQILHWQSVSRFCPVCGSATGAMEAEWVRHCPTCNHSRYPQVSPAVLALVHDGADRVLLAHKPGWGDRYSILAGFVLPGESLEECVQREVQEEVGAEVTALVYQGSQPWPFPHQLMIGYTARYVGGDLRLDEQELDHAAWFSAAQLPPLPPPLSLSRQIIDAWRARFA